MELLYILIVVAALFVGWATPQPAFAKKITDAIVAKFKDLTNKEERNDFQP